MGAVHTILVMRVMAPAKQFTNGELSMFSVYQKTYTPI